MPTMAINIHDCSGCELIINVFEKTDKRSAFAALELRKKGEQDATLYFDDLDGITVFYAKLGCSILEARNDKPEPAQEEGQ